MPKQKWLTIVISIVSSFSIIIILNMFVLNKNIIAFIGSTFKFVTLELMVYVHIYISFILLNKGKEMKTQKCKKAKYENTTM